MHKVRIWWIANLLPLLLTTIGSAKEPINGSPRAESFQCEQVYELPAGWTMLSLACEVEDSSLDGLFPTATSLFEFAVDSGYQAATSLEPGKGYWINMPAPATVVASGVSLSPCVVNFPAGWSMIGPCSMTASMTDIQGATNNKLISVFSFDAGYRAATILQPGRGYWINMTSAGVLNFGEEQVLDCNGVSGGDAVADNCGTCDNDPFNDCVKDCSGNWGGTYWRSDCGCVAADNSGDDCDDCNGTPNGDALLDDCGICSGGTTGHVANGDKDTSICHGAEESESDSANEKIPDSTDSIDTYYGTKIPSFVPSAPTSYELFDSDITVYGQLEGLNHEPTEAPGAGKFIFNRVYRSFKHGLEYGQQFGVFASWLSSFGNNSIEGGLWVNPKTAGPHYYPTLHLAGIGDTYHACNDVQMGSGLYERFLGDKWLAMIQISNKVLTVPGVNIAFDMEQEEHQSDNGIWIGSGWSYLNLDHPRNFKFWMSFIESHDYQGPINSYMPEHFNWIDPEKVSEGSYAERKAQYGDKFGTFATAGANQNWGNGNERIGLKAHSIAKDIYYVPVANLPNYKEREYLLAHPQSIAQSTMEDYSSALKAGTLPETLIPTTRKEFDSVYKSTHNQLKIIERINGEEHRYMIVPSYNIGFDSSLGYVEWDYSSAALEVTQRRQNGYLYVRKLADKWQVEDGASDGYKNHPHSYKTELIEAPDEVIRAPRVTHKFFSYKERDASHPDFQNWDTSGKTRHQVVLQNGSTATYVWFKFIEQPAVKTAHQNHPNIYTEAYLDKLQSFIENLHREINENSVQNPTNPVFINYRGDNNPDNNDLHLAKLDPAQLVQAESGFAVGYVPVVISVYHPEELSSNGAGLIEEPHEECKDSAWTDTYHPDIE